MLWEALEGAQNATCTCKTVLTEQQLHFCITQKAGFKIKLIQSEPL